MTYSIGEVAKLAKVSIRTLHHYDAIGLLEPSQRNAAGYRFYTTADLDKLQLILFYRTLEFPLDDIKRFLGKGDYDREAILLQQRELLMARASELAAVVNLINDTLSELRNGEEMTMGYEAMFGVFPQMDEAIIDEAQRQWGDTPAWQQSNARIEKYNRADWQRLKDAMAAMNREAERVFRTGVAPDSPPAIACAERDRLLIHEWFYDCSRAMHARVKDGVSQDPRFVANIDRHCAGLAAWLSAASAANLAANGENQS